MRHILFVASYGPSLINFRLHLIKKLLSEGYKVSVASPKNSFSESLQKELKDLGVKINIFSLSRVGLNFFEDCGTIFEINKIIKKSKPNVIISYTAKPVIYTGLILKFYRKIKFYPLITGLGFAFTKIDSYKKYLFRYIFAKLYQLSLKSAARIIFQNKDDQFLFSKLKIIKKQNISSVVNGSGVDLKSYPLTDLPSKPVFLMISRLLVDKGVREYVEAAKIVRSSFPNVRFQLAGGLDDNPASITNEELQSWIYKGDVEYLGKVHSVQSILKSCKYYVFLDTKG